jgi:hypothetical protein
MERLTESLVYTPPNPKEVGNSYKGRTPNEFDDACGARLCDRSVPQHHCPCFAKALVTGSTFFISFWAGIRPLCPPTDWEK